MEIKKTDRANLELHRREMFLVATVFILSLCYAALGWDISVSETEYDEVLNEVIENIDFSKLKRNNDMVAAITETDNSSEITKVKPAETVIVQQQTEATSTKLLIGESEGEVAEAKVEETKPLVLDNPDAKDLPEVFHVVEQLPEFPGGSTAFMKWLTKNIIYPSSAQTSKLKGRVVVSFIVDAEGNVKNLKVEKSNSQIFTNEVIRVLNTMPKWTPGKQNGRPCATMVSVPINFDM